MGACSSSEKPQPGTAKKHKQVERQVKTTPKTEPTVKAAPQETVVQEEDLTKSPGYSSAKITYGEILRGEIGVKGETLDDVHKRVVESKTVVDAIVSCGATTTPRIRLLQDTLKEEIGKRIFEDTRRVSTIGISRTGTLPVGAAKQAMEEPVEEEPEVIKTPEKVTKPQPASPTSSPRRKKVIESPNISGMVPKAASPRSPKHMGPGTPLSNLAGAVSPRSAPPQVQSAFADAAKFVQLRTQDACLLPPAPTMPESAVALSSSNAALKGFVYIEDNTVCVYNGSTTQQLTIEVVGVHAPEESVSHFDEQLRKEIVSVTAFPGEKKICGVEYLESELPTYTHEFSALSDEYIQWKKGERDQYIYDTFQGLLELVGESEEESEILRKAAEAQIPFIDMWFVPRTAALYGTEEPISGSDVPMEVNESGWSRNYLSPQSGGKSLFGGRTPHPTDIQPLSSNLTDRWLLCGISALAAYGKQDGSLIRDVFSQCTDEHMAIGGYKLQICKDGWWALVVLDDILPMLKNEPAFATNKHGANILWTSLLEKVLAKAMGSYHALTSVKYVDETIGDITGYPVKSYADETWVDNKPYMKEMIPDWVNVHKYLTVVSTPHQYEITQAAAKTYTDWGLQLGSAYTITKADDKNFTICNPWAEDDHPMELTVSIDTALSLFSALSVACIEPEYKEIRIAMPVDASNEMFTFGLQVDLNEGLAPFRMLIHGHQQDNLIPDKYGIMMVTVLGYAGDDEWHIIEKGDSWGPRDMILGQDDVADPGVTLNSSSHRTYFIAFHMHPQARIETPIVGAIHYQSLSPDMGTVTFKENVGWDYCDGRLHTHFKPDDLAPVDAHVQQRNGADQPIETLCMSSVLL